VIGYNVYRGTTSGGPYTKIVSAPQAGTTYTDSAVQSGWTYFYVVTAVDSNGNESSYSNEATAVIPTP
jgi:fibronectin type 3 domain-containing protein